MATDTLSIEDLAITSVQEYFVSSEFQDGSGLRDYLLGRQGNAFQAEEPVYDHIYRMVEFINRLRFKAEESNHNSPGRAINRLGALPLNGREIYDVLNQDSKEPPVTVITRIAQKDLGIFEKILPNMRKMLRRERRMIPVADAQQLDVRSMIWLTQQPGRTPAEKAGSRQRILAVVREENLNTLENRVLKAVLRQCLWGAVLYLKHYDSSDSIFHDTERIRAVRTLKRFATYALTSGELSTVGRLIGMPQPNYVLLHDARYMRVWQMYRELMHQTRLWEDVWKWRHQVFREYMLMLVAVAVDNQFQDKLIFHSDYWIYFGLKDGHFLECPMLSRVILLDGFPVEISLGERGWIQNAPQADIYVRYHDKRTTKVQLYYVPVSLGNQPTGEIKHNWIGWLHDEFELGEKGWQIAQLHYIASGSEWEHVKAFVKGI